MALVAGGVTPAEGSLASALGSEAAARERLFVHASQLAVLFSVVNCAECGGDEGVTAFWPGSHARMQRLVNGAAALEGGGGEEEDGRDAAPLPPRLPLRAAAAEARRIAADPRAHGLPPPVRPRLAPGDRVLALGMTVHAAVSAAVPMPASPHHPDDPAPWIARLTAAGRASSDACEAAAARSAEEGPTPAGHPDLGLPRFLQNHRVEMRAVIGRRDAGPGAIGSLIHESSPLGRLVTGSHGRAAE